MKLISRLTALLLMLNGCATLTTGVDDTVSVETDPAGAACEFKRDGELVGVVNPTPGSVEISKSIGDMVIACKLAGYFETTDEVRSEFQGMTLGNVLLGGIVGIAIDAASGAMGNYPENIHVALIPAAFKSEAERDAYFARIEKTYVDRLNKKITGIENYCDPSDRDFCAQDIKTLQERRDSKLRQLHTQLSKAVIDPVEAGFDSGR